VRSLPENTPSRTDKAIQRAQENESEWLTEHQMVSLIELFSSSKETVTAYRAINPANVTLVRKWIRKKLDIVDFEDFSTDFGA
jgi:hypothetical protein